MTAQEDFGSSSDKELVPSGLRGFRLFRKFTQLGDTKSYLTSMIRTKEWTEESWTVPQVASCAYSRITEVREAPCDCAWGLIGKKELDIPNYGSERMYSCSCKTKEPTYSPIHEYYHLYFPFEPVVEQAVVRTEPWHLAPAPERICQCGFYASYEHMTLITSPGCQVYPDDNYVLGVVEASGRVIMGSHGFRAEKMRIVDTSPVEVTSDHKPWLGLNSPVFDQEFLEKYPPDDLSGLLPEREEPKEGRKDHVNHFHWVNLGYVSGGVVSPIHSRSALWQYYWGGP